MKIALSLINLLFAATLLAWPFALFAVPFLFDAPGSESSMVTSTLAFSIVAYPAPIVIGNIAFWTGRKKAMITRLGVYTTITLIGPALVFVAGLALDLLCDGKFACA